MALTDIRLNVLEIVNEVKILLGLGTVSSLDADSHTVLMVNLLNDVIDELSDFGPWQQLYHETTVTAVASVATYTIRASGTSQPMQGILEIVWGDDIAAMEVRTIEDLRRLNRLRSFGTPRQFAIVGMSGDSPKFNVYPVPNTAVISSDTKGGVFDIAGYLKPVLYTTVTADVSAVPPFPARVLVRGLYAKALLEEAGGEATGQYEVVYVEYQRMRKEALNRFNADVGSDLYLTPGGGRYG